MTSPPRLTIALPVFNGERYLAGALEGLLSQTFGDFELIVGDNASTDGTADITLEFAARDARVRYVRHERNLGVVGNSQCLLDLARGSLFRFAADDDRCAPTLLERCIEALDAHPEAVLAYPKTRIIDQHGETIEDYEDNLDLQAPRPSDRFEAFFANQRLCNPLYGVIRTRILQQIGYRSFVGSDCVLLAELALWGTFYEVQERLFFRRFHPNASSAKKGAALQEFYNPGQRHTTSMMEWRHIWELWKVVFRAPISSVERWRVALLLLRRARWNRTLLARELWLGVRRIVTSRSRSIPQTAGIQR